MAAPSNLVLQLLITAKDQASAVFSGLFSFLDRTTSATANLIREKFTDLFGGGMTSAIEFEAQLDRVAAKGSYTADEVAQLKVAAQQLGAQFGISGTEAAKGMESLAAAGLSASDAIATLPQVLALASSEQISADAAATKLIDSLSVMSLGFEEAGRMADVLAKGANITTSSASQLAEALSEAGGVARAAGLDLEVTVAALDLLHKNGIKGSEAGTALKGVLTALLDPASKASQELDALGITSRDLGTVMGALQARGDAASTAILAFGTEAGPGLRALIGEGQTGLNDYTAQLRDAGGAAQEASQQMGGNLKSALATLSSAWESLKAALLDPLLEPITKQVKELAGAFQEGLSSDKFKAIQNTIQAFGEAAARTIGDFIRSFDFKGALDAVASFATSAKGQFESLAKAGKAAADIVTIAWNGVTAVFKVIGAAMVEVVASIVATLANIEEAASKVGLGSVERANELRQTALNMQQTAVDLLASVKTNTNEMGAAFDRLTTEADKAKVAVENLQNAAAVPPDALTLEPLVRSIEDYKAALDRAKVSQEQAAQAASDAEADYLLAGQALDNGTGSAYRYEEAARKNVAAQEALRIASDGVAGANVDLFIAQKQVIDGTDTELAAAAASIKTKQQQIQEIERARVAAKAYADAQQGLGIAQIAGLQAEINLAKAKGDTAEVQRLSRDLAIKEAEVSIKVAEAKQAEQQVEARLALAKLEQLNAIKEKNEEQKKQLELSLLVAQREVAEAEAAGVNAEAQRVLLEKLKQINVEKEKSVQASEQASQASREEAAATEERTKATDKNTEALDNNSRGFKQQIKNFEQLSEVGKKVYETTRLALTALYGDPRTDLGAVNAIVQMINDFNALTDAELAAVAEMEALTAAAEGVGPKADQAQAALIRMALSGSSGIEGLTQAGESARQKLEEIKNAALEAEAALAAMAQDFEKQILQIQGDEKALLKLEQEERLKQLDELYAKSGQLGSEEYLDAKARAEELHRLKMAQLETEAKGDASTKRMNDLADAATRAGSALKEVAGVDLAPIVTQAERLSQSFSDLNEAL